MPFENCDIHPAFSNSARLEEAGSPGGRREEGHDNAMVKSGPILFGQAQLL